MTKADLEKLGERLAETYGIEKTVICPGEHHAMVLPLQRTTAFRFEDGFSEALELLWPVIADAEYVRNISKKYAAAGMDVFALSGCDCFDKSLAKLKRTVVE